MYIGIIYMETQQLNTKISAVQGGSRYGNTMKRRQPTTGQKIMY